jgi:hypothetical protein
VLLSSGDSFPHFIPKPSSQLGFVTYWIVVEPGKPQMTIWCMRVACWIPKASNTHSQYVILIAFPLQQSLLGHAWMLRCTCIVWLVIRNHNLKWYYITKQPTFPKHAFAYWRVFQIHSMELFLYANISFYEYFRVFPSYV